MAITVSLNGTSYPIPEDGDTSWGPETTSYLVAAATGFFQVGAANTVTASSTFSANQTFAGILADWLKSTGNNPASSGFLRMSKNDHLHWRNNANTADAGLIRGSAANSRAEDELYYTIDNSTFQLLSGNTYVEASSNTAQTMTQNVFTTVIYEDEASDADGAYDPATGIFTVPTGKGGVYNVSATARLTGLTANTGIFAISIFINNVQWVDGTTMTACNGTVHLLQVAAPVNVAAGDTIRIKVYQSNGADRARETSSTSNRLHIKRMP